MPEKETAQKTQEQLSFTIPWAQKRMELGEIVASEEMIGRTWDVNEELLFFFLMWLGTY